MSQLTEISIVTKKVAVGFILVIISYILIKLLFDASIAYWKATHPKLLYPPQVEFGMLPSPIFTHVATSSSGLMFKLENVEGLPIKTATSASRVYLMPKKLPSLLAAQRAHDFAIKLGFLNKENPLTSTYYRFIDSEDKFRTLELDINNMNFKLQYDYETNPMVFTGETIQSKEQALTEVKNYIQFTGIFDGSILNGNITTTNLAYDPLTKTASIASSLSNTNLMRINYFRKDLDNQKILPPKFNESYNYALFTPADTQNKRILKLYYTFWPIAFDNFGTYPLRNSQVAWQDLVDGYAFIVNLGNNKADDPIKIRNIYLAYYDSEEQQSYLQPIYVFEGDNDFVAYLPAIASDWLE